MIVGLIVLLAGCVMSYMKLQPYSDYVLVAGAVIVIFRGAIRSREKAENIKPADNQEESDGK